MINVSVLAVVFGVDKSVFELENAKSSTIPFPFHFDVGARCSALALIGAICSPG